MAVKVLDKKAKATKVKAESNGSSCLCGCGKPTKARFAVGHDAQLKSRLINLTLDSKESAQTRRTAESSLAELGWTSHLERSRAAREARDEAKARAAAKPKAEKAAPKPKAPRAKKAKANDAPAPAGTEVLVYDEDDDDF